MIKVNLLPEGRKKKLEDRSLIIFLSIFSVSFLITLLIFLIMLIREHALQAEASALDQKVKTLKKEVDKLAPEVKLSEEEINNLENKRKVIELLMGKNRIKWAKLLNMIADEIPDNVYLYKFALTEKQETKKIAIVSNEKRKKKKKSKKTKTKYKIKRYTIRTIQLQGFTNSDSEKDLSLIATFMDNLRNDELFKKYFEDDIKFSSTKKVVVANKVVNMFEIDLRLKPIVIEE